MLHLDRDIDIIKNRTNKDNKENKDKNDNKENKQNNNNSDNNNKEQKINKLKEKIFNISYLNIIKKIISFLTKTHNNILDNQGISNYCFNLL